MAAYPHLDEDPFSQPIAVQVAGPVGDSLRGPSFVALELPPRDMPMALAGVARLLVGDRVIYCADGCNRFDPYRFSHWARGAGLDPTEVLQRVRLSRAFTIHQMAALATGEFPRLATGDRPPLLVILGFEELFLDEQIPRFEREFFFGRALRALVELRRRGGSLLVTISSPATPEERRRSHPWARQLARAADVMTRLRHLAGGTLVFEQANPRREVLHEPPADVVEAEVQVFL